MADEARDIFEPEREDIIKWHATVNSEFYDETVQAYAMMRLQNATEQMGDLSLDADRRLAAAAAWNVWKEVADLKARWNEGYQTMRTLDAQEEASERSEGELVGPRDSEQWHQHR